MWFTSFVNRGLPLPEFSWSDDTFLLLTGFVLVTLLVLLEVVDRFTCKDDLKIAGEIQLVMLPSGAFTGRGVDVVSVNTVGVDMRLVYDLIFVMVKRTDVVHTQRGRRSCIIWA